MTFACSRRSLVAMALAAGLVLPVAVSAAGPDPSGGHHTPTPGGHHGSTSGGSQRSPHQVSGILTMLPALTVPTQLTVLAGNTTITVTVPATTTIVRGYGGQSSLDEFVLGDHISAQGWFPTSSTFKARRITDWSVQAHGRVVGNVSSVQQNSLTLQATRRGHQYSSYQRSQPVTVTLTSTTLIVSGTVAAKPGALQPGLHILPGMRVLAMGAYNRTQSTLTATRVRVLSTRRRHP